MTNENIYDVLLYASSIAVFLMWFTAILTVGMKMAISNGNFRLLQLLLVICVVFTMQACGFLFNGVQFASEDPSNVSWQFQAGTIWQRSMSIFGAGAVLWYGRPVRQEADG